MSYQNININDLLINDNIKNIIFKHYNDLNFLIYGPPGTGKTTIIHSFINNINDVDKLLIDISVERGIEIIKNKVIEYINSISFHKNKIIIMDEMDSLTIDAQNTLNYFINDIKYPNVHYIFVCNYNKNIIQPIISKCAILRIDILPNKQLLERCLWKLNNLNISISENSINYIIKIYNCDIRKIFNFLNELSIIYKKSFIPFSIIKDKL